MYMDRNVRRHLLEYDVLAIIEWDVLVAHETSFEQLYFSAFQGEPFWVKGSVLGECNSAKQQRLTLMIMPPLPLLPEYCSYRVVCHRGRLCADDLAAGRKPCVQQPIRDNTPSEFELNGANVETLVSPVTVRHLLPVCVPPLTTSTVLRVSRRSDFVRSLGGRENCKSLCCRWGRAFADTTTTCLGNDGRKRVTDRRTLYP